MVVQLSFFFVEKNSHYESCLLKLILEFESIYCMGYPELRMIANYAFG